MLVVDSPFPPYAPVEYGIAPIRFAETELTCWSDESEIIEGQAPELSTFKSTALNYHVWRINDLFTRSDGRPAVKQELISDKGRTVIESEKLFWAVDGKKHRDGDLPSEIWRSPHDRGFIFEKKGHLHRFNEAAEIQIDNDGTVDKEFYLYGANLGEEQFLTVHEEAIKYDVPLWVALTRSLFNLNFDDKKLLDSLNENMVTLPVDWVLHSLDLNNEKWLQTGFFDEEKDVVSCIGDLVKYEKSYYVNC